MNKSHKGNFWMNTLLLGAFIEYCTVFFLKPFWIPVEVIGYEVLSTTIGMYLGYFLMAVGCGGWIANYIYVRSRAIRARKTENLTAVEPVLDDSPEEADSKESNQEGKAA